MFRLNINAVDYDLDIDPDTPLLWVLRDHLDMTGTKYGCGINQCGACTVQINGKPVRSCQVAAGKILKQRIVTIEGLSVDSSHVVQAAWVEADVPQCGYCQSGQIMAAAALLDRIPDPSDEDIDRAMNNICRCGTYQRIRKGIHLAAAKLAEKAS
ncbi:MAG: (2Fe-2S)-binding protein [Pseudomonadales bacterium]|nr:(2Fe-2S)-binding protein [Pseudomonadales bacterium]